MSAFKVSVVEIHSLQDFLIMPALGSISCLVYWHVVHCRFEVAMI